MIFILGPERCDGGEARVFVDGAPYFAALYVALEEAQTEIFIAGWMLTPELHLLRPPEKYPHTRLADVLKRRAEAGVKIYIALFKESSFAMYNSSGNSKKFLNNLHPNICAVRHPDHWNSEGVLYWSHHEKMVVIDKVVAFVGGIDLTLG